MRKVIAYLVAAVCLCTLAAAAEDFWVKKKYTQWSEKECTKMLTDSPWAREWSENFVNMAGTGEGGMDSTATATERQTNTQVGYRFRLRSALPIRQALVRRGQLAQGYAKMTEEQRQTFDEQAKQFLEATFADKVVVDVEYFSNVRGFLPDLANYWRSQNTERLRDKVYLLGANGRQASLAQYNPPRGDSQAFQFVFPRAVDGKPLVGPEDNSLRVQIQQPELSIRFLEVMRAGELGNVQTATTATTLAQVLVEFKVKKMILDGQLLF